MNSSSTNVNSKVKKIRDKLEEVMKENEAHKVCCIKCNYDLFVFGNFEE